MIKNSQNIFFVLFRGIFLFLRTGYLAFLSLFLGKNLGDIPKNFTFLSEIIEKGPKRFFVFPTAIRLGRAIFAPILFLFSHKKNDKNS